MRAIRRIVYALTLVFGLWLVAGWLIVGQNSGIVVPFSSTPSINGITTSNFTQVGTLLARKIDGTYVPLQFFNVPPYMSFGDTAALTSYLSAGISNLLAAPAGPAGVGLASQISIFGKFTTAGDAGGAVISPTRERDSVRVYLYANGGLYSSSTRYVVGPNTAYVVAADFNGDGVADLAVSYQGDFAQGSPPGGVGILINQGNGTFNAPVSLAAGTRPSGLATWDLNHDNKLDLVVTDKDGSLLRVLLGNGNGTFGAAAPFTIGNTGAAVTIADFNGDTHPDLAATAYDNSVSILLGNGNGTFQARTSFLTGGRPDCIAAGDFNKDGKLDLATANANSQTVTVFAGNGSGAFQRVAGYNVGYSPETIVLTDYNTDGNLDIIVGQGDARVIFPEYSTGKFDTLLGRGDGTFIGASSTSLGGSGFGTRFVETGDFNGDGRPDSVADNQGKLYFMAGAPNASFAAPVAINGQPASVYDGAAGDFNGDGRPDMAVPGGIFLNVNGVLQSPTAFATGGLDPRSVTAADFDGDGKLDLAVANYGSGNTSGNITVFRGGGNGTVQLVNTYTAGFRPKQVRAGDLNGDGRPDLVVADEGQFFTTPPLNGAVYVLLNSGNGFQTPVQYPAGLNPVGASVGDVNGDGKPDVAAATTSANFGYRIAISLGNGDGTLQAAALITTDFGPRTPVIRDFDGDGKTDLVVPHCCGSVDMTFFQGNGNGTFQPEVHFNGGADPVDVNVVDLDGNGAPDIVIAGGGGTVTGLLNTSAPSSVCTLSPTTFSPTAAGANVTINVTSGACTLTPVGLPDWITVANTTPTALTLAVAPNAGAARNANFTVGGVPVTVNQPAAPTCTYSLSFGQSFPAVGGNGVLGVTSPAGCAWTVTGAPNWVVLSSTSGSGNGTVNYQVTQNVGAARTVFLSTNGNPDGYRIDQQAATIPGLAFVGSMPHLAVAGSWETIFTLANTSAGAAQSRLNFYDDPGIPLALPLWFPAPPITASSLDRDLPANGSLTLRSTGPDTQTVQVGSAQLQATGGVGGFVIFRYLAVNQEAVVPLETRDAPSYVLAFDNTNGVALGVGVQNVLAQTVDVPVIVRNDLGENIGGGSVRLGPNGHNSFVVHTQFPATANKRGTVEFQRPAGGRISALGVRFTPPGTLTTIPALANVTAAGGSVAHIAAGGGWKTTVVLVNTGSSAAQATVKFLSGTGTPLTLPVTFPQSGASGPLTQADANIAANASLVFESSGPVSSAVQIGSMQLTTTGNVSGYVIFRYEPNGQEASVPFERRTVNAYVIPFDHTDGINTGTAVNNASAQALNIPVILRDESGAQIPAGSIGPAGSIQLAANGQTAFVLSTQFPATAGIRGTMELVPPAGAIINVLGIRTPPTLSFTTLPPLVK